MIERADGTDGPHDRRSACGHSKFDWIVQALFLDASPRRLETLARVAGDPTMDWSGLVQLLEIHHVLPPVWRNLRAAGVKPPRETAARLENREAELREDARRDRVTLECFLETARVREVEVVLLKGASLELDLYADPALRYRSDLDLLVDRGRLAAALAAAREAGFVMRDAQFPDWWYRLVHFHVSLQPVLSLMKPIEIHWRLHSSALLLTIDPQTLLQRSQEVTTGRFRVRTLHPVDRLLHLSTHLVSHWRHVPAQDGMGMIHSMLAAAEPPVCLKWVLDLVLAVERLAETAAVEDVARGAREWSAVAPLRCALALVAACPVSERASDWVRRIAAEAELPSAGRPAGRRRPVATRSSGLALNFRWETLGLLPRWIWPPAAYLSRRYSLPAGRFMRLPAMWIVRWAHAVAVLFRVGLAVLVYPLALLCRPFLGLSRRRRRAATFRPNRVLEIARVWEQAGGQESDRSPSSADDTNGR